jgi:hypothetical protein
LLFERKAVAPVLLQKLDICFPELTRLAVSRYQVYPLSRPCQHTQDLIQKGDPLPNTRKWKRREKSAIKNVSKKYSFFDNSLRKYTQKEAKGS